MGSQAARRGGSMAPSSAGLLWGASRTAPEPADSSPLRPHPARGGGPGGFWTRLLQSITSSGGPPTAIGRLHDECFPARGGANEAIPLATQESSAGANAGSALPRQQPSRRARRTTGSPRLSGSHAARGRRHPPRYCFPDGIGRPLRPRAIPVLNLWCPARATVRVGSKVEPRPDPKSDLIPRRRVSSGRSVGLGSCLRGSA